MRNACDSEEVINNSLHDDKIRDNPTSQSSSNLRGAITVKGQHFEGLESLGQTKLKKLSKAISDIMKSKRKHYKYTKYGNVNKGFTEQELQRFLSSCNNPFAYLAFFLMAHLGLRVSEVCRIKVDDIDWHGNKLRISTLKAETGDFLFLPAAVRKLLETQVRKFPQEIRDHDGYVLFSTFNRERRKHISPNWLRNEFRRVCLLANLDEWYDYSDDRNNPRQAKNRKLHRLTTHSLRHYFISKVYGHCKNPILTQKLARHQDFKSTQMYIHINYEKLGKVIEEVFEPQDRKEKEDLEEFMLFYAKYRQLKDQQRKDQ